MVVVFFLCGLAMATHWRMMIVRIALHHAEAMEKHGFDAKQSVNRRVARYVMGKRSVIAVKRQMMLVQRRVV